MSHYSEVPKVAILFFIIYWTLANFDKSCNKSRKVKNFKNCIQCLDFSVNVYDTRVTSVGCACYVRRVFRFERHGFFSEPLQRGIPNEPFR